MFKKFFALLSVVTALCVMVFFATMVEVYLYSKKNDHVYTDAAIVLGAAAWGPKPSPVFRERINHAVTLYKKGLCHYIIFTGGKGFPEEKGESVIARDYAMKMGVNEAHILVENRSKNTAENLKFAQELSKEYSFSSYTLVSDPYHLRRAVYIAEKLGMNVVSSPTPTTRFKGREKKLEFLIKESYLLLLYRLKFR